MANSSSFVLCVCVVLLGMDPRALSMLGSTPELMLRVSSAHWRPRSGGHRGACSVHTQPAAHAQCPTQLFFSFPVMYMGGGSVCMCSQILHPLELELQAVVSYPMWVLGTELPAPGRTVPVFCLQAISCPLS